MAKNATAATATKPDNAVQSTVAETPRRSRTKISALPSDMSDDAAVRQIGKPMALVFRGFLVNISNPKALVFMLAVLPQFIDPHAPLLIQYLIIGVTMVCVDLIVMAGYTGLASKVLRLLRTPKQQKRMNRTFAGLFIGAAAFMATLRKAAV